MAIRKKAKRGIKKFDKIITGIVLGGVVAGAFGYRQRKKKKLLALLEKKKKKSGFGTFLKELISGRK